MQNKKMSLVIFPLIIFVCVVLAVMTSSKPKQISKTFNPVSYENLINVAKDNIQPHLKSSMAQEDKDILLVHEVLVQLNILEEFDTPNDLKRKNVMNQLHNEIKTTEAKTAILYFMMKNSTTDIGIDNK